MCTRRCFQENEWIILCDSYIESYFANNFIISRSSGRGSNPGRVLLFSQIYTKENANMKEILSLLFVSGSFGMFFFLLFFVLFRLFFASFSCPWPWAWCTCSFPSSWCTFCWRKRLLKSMISIEGHLYRSRIFYNTFH